MPSPNFGSHQGAKPWIKTTLLYNLISLTQRTGDTSLGPGDNWLYPKPKETRGFVETPHTQVHIYLSEDVLKTLLWNDYTLLFLKVPIMGSWLLKKVTPCLNHPTLDITENWAYYYCSACPLCWIIFNNGNKLHTLFHLHFVFWV